MRISWTEKKSNEVVMEKGRIQTIPTQNHQKKTTTIFGHINRADGLEKQILSEKIKWYQKQRKTTQKIRRLSE